MKIAIPAEADAAEPRVAATPDTVKKLKALGADVVVADRRGREVRHARRRLRGGRREHRPSAPTPWHGRRRGAQGAPPDRRGADATTSPARSSSPSWTRTATRPRSPRMAKAGVVGFAMELMPRITRAQVMDVLSSQANLAGYRAVIDASAEFGRAFPMMMTAAGTVPAARVFVMGVGVAGLQAIATARRLGAHRDGDRRAPRHQGAGGKPRREVPRGRGRGIQERRRPPAATPRKCRRSIRPSRPRWSPSTSRSRTSSSPRR